MIDGKEILITGGCGTLGKELIWQLKKNYKPRGIRIYSRDENKHLMVKHWLLSNDISISQMEFIIGDIVDYRQFKRATKTVDIIIHAAALKQVPACEDNPIEANRVNVLGTESVIMAALENDIEQVIYIATDKGVYPITYYGLTKSLAERLVIFGCKYAGNRNPLFKVCRYGNVIGSRGSVVQVWNKQVQNTGKIKITHSDMTRFFIPLKDVAKFVLDRLQEKETGKIYVPKMKSIEMGVLAEILFPGVPQENIGIRPGEKMHESIIGAEECAFLEDRGDYFMINAYDMKLMNMMPGESKSFITSYDLDSYNNPDIWGEEIKEFCEVKE